MVPLCLYSGAPPCLRNYQGVDAARELINHRWIYCKWLSPITRLKGSVVSFDQVTFYDSCIVLAGRSPPRARVHLGFDPGD